MRRSLAVGFNSGSVGLNVFLATTEAYVDGGVADGDFAVGPRQGQHRHRVRQWLGRLWQHGRDRRRLPGPGQRQQDRSLCRRRILLPGQRRRTSDDGQRNGALDIEATTIDRFQADPVGGALATGCGGPATANIEIANNVTIAGIYDTTVASPGGGAAGAVTVNSTEDVAIKEIAGALAIATGGVGIGAAANILVFKSQTTAETRNSDITSSGVVDVEASSTKEVLSYAVTAGVGSSVGIGAAVGVIIIGSNTTDPAPGTRKASSTTR